MSVVSELRYSLSITNGGALREWAQPFVAPQLTFTAMPDERNVVIAASATATLWDVSQGGNIAAWKFMLCTSDVDVDVKFTLADATVFSVRVVAGVPLLLGSNVSSGSGSASTVSKLEATNTSSTDSATVRVVLANE